MKYKSIVAFVAAPAISIFMSSCEKKDGIPASRKKQEITVVPVNTTGVDSKGGGEDDDKPIIMHSVFDELLSPLQYAVVIMIDSDHRSDSFQLFTDYEGKCTFNLPDTGNWDLKIGYHGYQPLDTVIHLVDSFNVKTTVLQPQ